MNSFMQIWTKQLATAALSAVMLASTYGCAGVPRAGGPGAAGGQQGAIGGAEGGGVAGQAENAGRNILGGIGGILGDGVPMAGHARTDMGQQISAAVGQALGGGGGVLGMGARGAPGDAAGNDGGVGVSTLVVGNMALVGVNLEGPADIEGTVQNQVRAAFPQIADVYVTTDPDLVHQISVIAGDIQQGVSVAGRLEEVFSIVRHMTEAGMAGGGGR